MDEKEEQRLKTLLGDGYYFPDNLPPQFTTAKLAELCGSIVDDEKWGNSSESFHAEIYSAPKYGSGRRLLSLVPPVSQIRVAQMIARFWEKIRKHFKKSECSAHIPEIDDALPKHFDTPQFDLWKNSICAKHECAVAVDILRFYETTYTHAIAWALAENGKIGYKRLSREEKKEADVFDAAIRSGQGGQSVGIPIGPYTSRIVSEIIGVAIDENLQKMDYVKSRAVRHVDDWFIGLDSDESSQKIIAEIAAQCREFGFHLNLGKTKTGASVNFFSMPEWKAELMRYNADSGNRTKSTIEGFFAKAFFFAQKYPDHGVLSYAVKSVKFWKIESGEDWNALEECLLMSARHTPRAINLIAEIFAFRQPREDVNRDRVKSLVDGLILKNANLGNHYEVSWALALAKEFELKIDESAAKSILKMNSSICALLLLDLHLKKCVDGNCDAFKWLVGLNSDDLQQMWLLAYEAARKGWPVCDIAKGTNHYFCDLRKKGVFFYDSEITIAGMKDKDSEKADESYCSSDIFDFFTRE